MRTLVHFSALNETMDLLTSMSGFGDGELAQFEEMVKSLLEDLIVRPNSMWVESAIDNQKK